MLKKKIVRLVCDWEQCNLSLYTFHPEEVKTCPYCESTIALKEYTPPNDRVYQLELVDESPPLVGLLSQSIGHVVVIDQEGVTHVVATPVKRIATDDGCLAWADEGREETT